MDHVKRTLYYTRTETPHDITIVWRPFTTYSVYVLLALLFLSLALSLFVLGFLSVFLLLVNAVFYYALCKTPREEIKAVEYSSKVSTSGNKHSFSSPLTITIPKDIHYTTATSEAEPSSPSVKGRGHLIWKGFLGVFAVIFILLDLLVFLLLIFSSPQGVLSNDISVYLILFCVFLLLAYLCIREIKK